MKTCLVISITFLSLASSWNAVSTTFYVNPGESIQAALDGASSWDTIVVADGTYSGDGNRDIDFGGKSITLQSANGAESCIIDCGGSDAEPHRAFYFHSGETSDAVVEGFTITGGYADDGGAIYCGENCNPAVIDCVIEGNTATSEGGGLYGTNSDVTVSGCTFRDNLADRGGGLFCYAGAPAVERCSVRGNTSTGSGAGMFFGYGDSTPTVVRCTAMYNCSHMYGGGVFFYSSAGSITNCIVAANTALRNGGGTYFTYGSVAMMSCTVARNTALQYGGGMYFEGIHTTTITNSIVWGNGLENVHDDGTLEASFYYCDIGGGWAGPGSDNIEVDPWLKADPVTRLSKDSPCRNAGTSTGAPVVDFDDEPRSDGFIDIGADEYWDSDGDGLLDYWEMRYFEDLDENGSGDPDLDGVINSKEYNYGTRPDDANGDGDALGDAYEIANDIDATVVTHYVSDSEGDDSYDGLLHYWDGTHGPKKTIQAGIDTATSAVEVEEVIVLEGTYAGAGNRDLDFSHGLPANRTRRINLRSRHPYDPNNVANTIIDCGGSDAEPHRAFHFHSGECPPTKVSGFTIRNGWQEDGGGIYCELCSPTVLNCVITDCHASDDGGGINVCADAAIDMDGCDISDNATGDYGYGGGIYYEGHNSGRIANSGIVRNSAGIYGGGLYLSGTEKTPTVEGCSFVENTSGTAGAGMMLFYSDASIRDCLITANTSDNYGGGIYYSTSGGSLVNTVVDGNRAHYGGGISFVYEGPTLTNCTITGNIASSYGGGFYSSTSHPEISNSILWDNSPTQYHLSGGLEPTLNNCDVEGGWSGAGSNNIDDDPVFVADGYWDALHWVQGTYHLVSNSPCIDTGTNGAPELPDYDMDGNHRVWFGKTSWTVDMGPYEYGSEPLVITWMSRSTEGHVELTWDSSVLPGVTYSVMYCDEECSEAMVWRVLESGISSGGSETTWTDTSAGACSRRHYRILDERTSGL